VGSMLRRIGFRVRRTPLCRQRPPRLASRRIEALRRSTLGCERPEGIRPERQALERKLRSECLLVRVLELEG